MAAAPWYLLAGGIALVIVGYFIASLGRGSGRVFITHKMSDEEVERQLNQDRGNPVAGFVMLLGFVIILTSIIWRIVRIFA
jgi:hypothetical protein